LAPWGAGLFRAEGFVRDVFESNPVELRDGLSFLISTVVRGFSIENWELRTHTIAPHVLCLPAHPVVVEDWLDDLAARLGSNLLAAIRRAEFPFLLRYRQRADRGRTVDGKPADFLVDSMRIARLPDDLCRRFDWRPLRAASQLRWLGLHVRSAPATIRSPAQPLSHRYAAAAFVGDLAPWIRFARMEAADVDDVDRHPHQLFLASAVRRELGAGIVFSPAPCDPGMGLSAPLFHRGAPRRVFSHSSRAAVGDRRVARGAEAWGITVPITENRCQTGLEARSVRRLRH
jgi:hypothetical protein